MPKASPKLTKAQQFYIESHFDMELTDLAADLELSVKTVSAYIEKLKADNFKATPPAAKKSKAEEAGFGVGHKNTGSLSVVMTKSASEKGDDAPKGGTGYLNNERLKDAIYVPDPGQPIR